MISKLVAIVLRRPTTEAALVSLSKTLAKLDAVTVHHSAKADKHTLAAQRHRELEVSAMNEADRAKRIADRMAALLA